MSVHLAKHEDMARRGAANIKYVGTPRLAPGARGFLCCARDFYADDDDLSTETGVVWRRDATVEAVEEPHVRRADTSLDEPRRRRGRDVEMPKRRGHNVG